MLIGDVGAGKSTLFGLLFGRSTAAAKTQALEFEGQLGIDSPGEYFSHPRMYHALLSTAADVQRLLYVHAADRTQCRLPPGLLEVYAHQQVDAVITKTDLAPQGVEAVEASLRQAGIHGQVFRVHHHDGASIAALRQYLLAPVEATAVRPSAAPFPQRTGAPRPEFRP